MTKVDRSMKHLKSHNVSSYNSIISHIRGLYGVHPLSPFDSPTTNYSCDFTQHWDLVPNPFCVRLAVSLFPACATVPYNQCRIHQHIGIFPRSEGENAVTRRAQYRRMGRGREWVYTIRTTIISLFPYLS